MPQIKEYTSQVDTLRPSETGVESLAGAGRRAGAFYNQAAETQRQAAQDVARAAVAQAGAQEDVAKTYSGVAKTAAQAADSAETYVAHQEISHGAATFAQLHSNLTDSWNNVVSDPKTDPNDTSLAGRFREEQLEPQLESFVSSFHTRQGQQWAQEHVAALRDHMFEKQSADVSTLAGDAVVTNYSKAVNAMSNTARNDPSAVPFLLDTAKSSLDGIISSSPNLKGTAAARVRTESLLKMQEDIVRAGALGVAEKSGGDQAAMDAYVKQHGDLIKPGESDQLTKAAKAYRVASATDEERARRLAKEQAEDKSEAKRDQYLIDINGDNSQTTMRQILSDRELTPKDREHLIGVIKNEGKTAQSDPQVYQGLIRGVFNADNPTTVYDVMRQRGKLNDRDFDNAIKFVKLSQDAAVDNPTYKETIRSTEKMFGTGPIGLERHAQFMQDFLPQYLKAKREGTDAGALDTRDPNSLISKVLKDHPMSENDRLKDQFAKSGMDPNALGNFFGPNTTINRVDVQEAPAKPPSVGTTIKGYRFKGGDPSKQSNWEKVEDHGPGQSR